jgi:hypothetical protein
VIAGTLVAALAAGCGDDGGGGAGPTGASFDVDYSESCSESETCAFNRPLLAGGGIDLFVTLREPLRDPLFDLVARSGDETVLAVEATVPNGDPEVDGERIYLVSVRGIAAGSTTLELVSTTSEVLARTDVRVAVASELVVHVGAEAEAGPDGLPEIGLGDTLSLWVEPLAADGSVMFAGDGPMWSIPSLDVAALLTDDGDATTAMGETTLVAGNSAGTVMITVTAMDATAVQPVHIVDAAVPP